MKSNNLQRKIAYMIVVALLLTNVCTGSFFHAETVEEITNAGLNYSGGLPTENKTYKAGEGVIKYEADTKTLTLENATVSTDASTALNFGLENINIVVKGKNEITTEKNSAITGMDITIKGEDNAELHLISKDNTDDAVDGLQCNNLEISGSVDVSVTKVGVISGSTTNYNVNAMSISQNLSLNDSAKLSAKEGNVKVCSKISLSDGSELNAKMVKNNILEGDGTKNFILRTDSSSDGVSYTVYGNVALGRQLEGLTTEQNKKNHLKVNSNASLDFDGVTLKDDNGDFVEHFKIINDGAIRFTNNSEFANTNKAMNFSIENNGTIHVADGKKLVFHLKKLPAITGTGQFINDGTVEFVTEDDTDTVDTVKNFHIKNENGIIVVTDKDGKKYYYNNDGIFENTVDAGFILNFNEDKNDRATAGVSWAKDTATNSYTLTLDSVYLEKGRPITLPQDEKIIIKAVGNSKIKSEMISDGTNPLNLTVTGNGILHLNNLPNGSANHDTITIQDGVKVYVKDYVSCGGSGSAESFLNVKGEGTLLDIDVTNSPSSDGTSLQEINITDGATLNIRARRIGARTITGSAINVKNKSKLKVACKYGVYVVDGKLIVDDTSTLETNAASAGIVVLDTTNSKTKEDVLSLPDIPYGTNITSAVKNGNRLWTIAKTGSTVEVIGNNVDPADDITGALGKMTIKKGVNAPNEGQSGGGSSSGGSGSSSGGSSGGGITPQNGGTSGSGSTSNGTTSQNGDTAKDKNNADDKKTDIKKFDDVKKEDWYYDSVVFAVENGYMKGISENKFAPMMSTSRAMISQIIYSLENTPKTTAKHNFTDIAKDVWYEQSLNFTFDKGIVMGFPDKTFRGNITITREQLSAILYRYAKYKGYDTDTDADMSKYEDFENTGDWAKLSVKWAVKHSIVKGRTDTRLNPTSELTRAELATVLKNFHSEFVK